MPPKPKEKKHVEKLHELEKAIKDERSRAETYLNQLKYVKADLENLQKRMQKSIDEAVDRSKSRLLMKMLPFVDEMNLAIEVSKNANKKIIEGFAMIKTKFEKLLETEGVYPIESTGKLFDPNLHEAVLEADSSEQPDGYVVEEFRKGFIYKDRVLRPSMVKVARNPSMDKD